MTSRVERKTRELADRYMADRPGVTRQQAKRAVRPYAEAAVAVENVASAWNRMLEQARPDILRVSRALSRRGRS